VRRLAENLFDRLIVLVQLLLDSCVVVGGVLPD